MFGPVAHLARAPVLHSGGKEFDSPRVHNVKGGNAKALPPFAVPTVWYTFFMKEKKLTGLTAVTFVGLAFFSILILASLKTVNPLSLLANAIGGLPIKVYYLDPISGNDINDGLSPAAAWKTMAKVSSVNFQAGDVVDGQGNTFFERLAPISSGVSGQPIVFKNFTLDGTVSFDDQWTFFPADTYSLSKPWTLFSGEIYRKETTRLPYDFFEDGLKLTPVVSSTASSTLTLARGQFTGNNNYIYYRASDGGLPLKHTIRVARRDLATLPGGLYLANLHDLQFQNVTVKNWDRNIIPASAVMVIHDDHVSFVKLVMSGNFTAVDIDGSTYVSIDASSVVSDNIVSGTMIEGNSSHIDLSGDYSRNGRTLHYDGVNLNYAQDGDGIGIGGSGGTITDIIIHDATISNNGAPDGNTNDWGSGIYSGTSNPMTVSSLSILNSKIFGNHAAGIHIDRELSGSNSIFNNTIYQNINFPDNGSCHHAVAVFAGNAGFASMNIDNNMIALNPLLACGAALYIGNAGSGTVTIQNNSFYNNGNVTAFTGDLWIQNPVSGNVVEHNNHFTRMGTAWDSALVIKQSIAYDIAHILGVSAGFWQRDSGLGQSDTINDVPFVIPGSVTQTPGTTTGAGTSGGGGNGGSGVSPIPQNLSATSTLPTRVVLTWNPPSNLADVLEYRIYRNNDFFAFALTPPFIDGGLNPATTYTYAVATVDRWGNDSSLTSPVSITTLSTTTITSATTTAITQQQQSITASSTSVSVLFTGPFTPGVQSDQVSLLQKMLAQDVAIYPNGAVTGYFDSLTKAAVGRFQEKYQLATPSTLGYGGVGPLTLAKLNEVYGVSVGTATTPQKMLISKRMSLGAKGEQVTILQTKLASDSTIYPNGLITGYYGLATKAAVGRFQEKYQLGIPSTPGYGGVGPLTLAKFNEVYGGGAK